MIKKILKKEKSAANTLPMSVDIAGTSSPHLQLMKATVMAESSYLINFHRALSAPEMSTDVSQVGVAVFPSF